MVEWFDRIWLCIQALRLASASHQVRPSKDGATRVRIVLPSASPSTLPEDSAMVCLTGFALVLRNARVVEEAGEEIKPH
jgi:hypothetical protein